jgi:hypothetical protein
MLNKISLYFRLHCSHGIAPASLRASSELDVSGRDDVEAGEHTSASNTTKDVRAGTLHEGHKALVLDDLLRAVDGTVVLDGAAGRHHHASSDGVDWVGHEAGHDGDAPAEEEGEKSRAVLADEDWLERVVETKVHTSVDEDTDARDHEATVETANTVRGEGLSVDVDETVVLSLATLGLVVVSQSSTGVVERVDDGEGHGTGKTTGRDVDGELLPLWGILRAGKHGLDGVLEGKVKSLGWEVSEDVGQVTSPERDDALGSEGSLAAVDDAAVWLVESALLDHLILVLDEELDSLNWRGDGLGDTGGDTREHKVLKETKLLLARHDRRTFIVTTL